MKLAEAQTEATDIVQRGAYCERIEGELKKLFGSEKPVPPATLRLNHETKKRASALVASPEPLSKEMAGQIPSDAGVAGAVSGDRCHAFQGVLTSRGRVFP